MLIFYGLRSSDLNLFQLYIRVIVTIDSQNFSVPDMISLLWYEHGIEHLKRF